MKRQVNLCFTSATVVGLSSLLVIANFANAQSAAPSYPPRTNTIRPPGWDQFEGGHLRRASSPDENPMKSSPWYGTTLEERPDDSHFADSERAQKLADLQRQVLDAKNDEKERAKLMAKLTEELEGLFDEEIERRDVELKKLEERVDQLRENIEKRRSNRDRIIKNYVDSLLLKAEGLTFPSFAQPKTTGREGADSRRILRPGNTAAQLYRFAPQPRRQPEPSRNPEPPRNPETPRASY